MEFEVVSDWDAATDLGYPYVRGDRRPRQITIGPDPSYGVESSPERLDDEYILIRGTDLFVPRREAYVAFGGQLLYDVTLVIGFDGIASPLLDVRFRERPDKSVPISSTGIRTVRLDGLVQQAISENRTAYRRVSATRVVRVNPDDRQAVYLDAMRRASGETRRRISDDQLQRVAESYVQALAERRSPTKAVEERLRLPNRNVAKKWVQKARAAGFLAPASGERRGGIQ